MARGDPSSLSRVPDFTVGREGMGSVRWLDPVDIRGVDLDRAIDFKPRAVEVYMRHPDAKPPEGKGLNRPAEVELLGIFKKDKTTGEPVEGADARARFKAYLQKKTAQMGAEFVSYDPENGSWRFRVPHFSRYGLDGDDEEGDDSGARCSRCGMGVAFAAEFV